MIYYRAYCNTSLPDGTEHNWSDLYNTEDGADLALYNHRRHGNHTDNTDDYGIDEVEVQITVISSIAVKRAK